MSPGEARQPPEPRFEALARSAPIGIYELTPEGECVFVNDHWCELAGVGPEGGLGFRWRAVIHPSDLDRVTVEWRRASDDRRPFALEYRYVRADGAVVWVAGRAAAIRDGADRVTGYMGCVIDITAEREMREATRHFHLIHDLVATCGFDGRFKRLHGAWEALLGLTPEELYANPFLDVVHPDDRDEASAAVGRLRAGEMIRDFKARIVAADGRSIWTEWSGSPDLDAGVFYCTGRDVSARVAAEEALAQEREALAEAEEVAKVGSWQLDLASGTRMWSAQQSRNLGFDPSEPPVSAEAVIDAVHPTDRERVAAEAESIVANPRPFALDYRIRHPDGSVHEIEVVGRPSTGPDGSVLLTGTSRDVTAEREAERLKHEFFSLISHELRTPLTSIVGYSELLREYEAEALSDRGRKFIEVIERNSRRQLKLVGDLLLLARVNAGAFGIARETVDVAALIERAIESAEPAASSVGVTIGRTGLAEAAVSADPDRLAQVLDNLISNAIKFSPQGGAVSVGLERSADVVSIEVSDEGIGISPQEAEHLFDRMYRSESAQRLGIEGTGLGLAIVRAIVEAHGGSVGARGEPGRGATLRVELPVGSGPMSAASEIGTR